MTSPDEMAGLLASLARRTRLPPALLLAIVKDRVKSAAAVAPGALEEQISRRALDLAALKLRLAAPGDESALARWRAAAAAAIEAGQLGEADRALAQAELQLFGGLADFSQMPGERRVAAARTRADRAIVALGALSAEGCQQGAQRYAEASAIVGPADPALAHGFALAQGEALARLGEEFFEAEGPRAAIAHLRRVAAGLDSYDDAVAFSEAQERIAAACATLAGLTGDRGAREEAAAACRLGLDDLRRDRAPALWTRLQRQLGRAALALGEQGGGADAFEEAAAALRAALAATAKAAEPESWTEIQFDLGRALSGLGQSTGGMASLEAAFNALQAATGLWTRETQPARWAEAQDRMGLVLMAMGERYSETVVIEEAVASFRAALEERSRETQPLLWAASTANAGFATLQLAERRKDAMLAQTALTQILGAVEAMRAAGFAANAGDLQRRLAEAGSRVAAMARR